MRFLLTLALLAASVPAWAADLVLVKTQAGYYTLTQDAAGVAKLTKVDVQVIDLTSKTPTPVPTDTPLQVKVKQLTGAALAAGGKPETAAKLAGVFALVSDFCADGTISAEMARGTAQAPGFLSQAIDRVMADATDKAAWANWRKGVGDELGFLHPTTPTNAALAGSLRQVSNAIKAHISASHAAVEASGRDAGELNIDWSAIIELLRPIIRELLLKFLTDWINKTRGLEM